MESSGSPYSQASPALALLSGPIRATPYKWVPRGRWEGEPSGTPLHKGDLIAVHSCTHSQVPELELMPLETPQALPLMLVHGTFWKHWPSILLKGLSCQGRAHIHLASGLPGDPGVISGQYHLQLFCPPRLPTKRHSFLCVRPLHRLARSSISRPHYRAPFCPSAPGPCLTVPTGMRPNCEVVVFIDGPLALAGKCGPPPQGPSQICQRGAPVTSLAL